MHITTSTNSQALNSASSCIAVTDSTIYVTYVNANDIYVITSIDGGSNWGSPINISSSNLPIDLYPCIILDGTNRPYIFWWGIASGAGTSKIYYSYKQDNGQWLIGGLTLDTNNLGVSTPPSVATDSLGNLWVSWGQSNLDGNTRDVVVKKKLANDLNTWSTVYTINAGVNGLGGGVLPVDSSIAINSNNDVGLIYWGSNTGNDYSRRFYINGNLVNTVNGFIYTTGNSRLTTLNNDFILSTPEIVYLLYNGSWGTPIYNNNMIPSQAWDFRPIGSLPGGTQVLYQVQSGGIKTGIYLYDVINTSYRKILSLDGLTGVLKSLSYSFYNNKLYLLYINPDIPASPYDINLSILDVTAAGAAITNLVPSAYYNTDPLPLIGVANLSTTSVKVSLDTINWLDVGTLVAVSGGYSWGPYNLDIPPGDGEYLIECKGLGVTDQIVPSGVSIFIDRTEPYISHLTSPTHPNDLLYYFNDVATFNWTGVDAVGISGYYFILDHTIYGGYTGEEVVTENNFTPQTSLTSGSLLDGTYYFHLVPIDLAGNYATNPTIRRINVISEVGINITVTNITARSATVSFALPFSASASVYYSETGQGTWAHADSDTIQTNHVINVVNLLPLTTYDFYIIAGSLTTAVDQFQTLVYVPTPPVITNVAAVNITFNTAAISWRTDIASSSTVEWGLTNSYGNTTTGPTAQWDPYLHYVPLTGLTAETEYHYRVISSDPVEGETISNDYTFSTIQDTTELIITDVVVTPIEDVEDIEGEPRSMAINWVTNRPATSLIRLGLTPENMGWAGEDVNYNINHNLEISSLNPNTNYYYQLISRSVLPSGEEYASRRVAYYDSAFESYNAFIKVKINYSGATDDVGVVNYEIYDKLKDQRGVESWELPVVSTTATTEVIVPIASSFNQDHYLHVVAVDAQNNKSLVTTKMVHLGGHAHKSVIAVKPELENITVNNQNIPVFRYR